MMHDDMEWLNEELADVIALLRTSVAPDAWNMSASEWARHKCNKAAGKLHSIMDRLSNQEEIGA